MMSLKKKKIYKQWYFIEKHNTHLKLDDVLHNMYLYKQLYSQECAYLLISARINSFWGHIF